MTSDREKLASRVPLSPGTRMQSGKEEPAYVQMNRQYANGIASCLLLVLAHNTAEQRYVS